MSDTPALPQPSWRRDLVEALDANRGTAVRTAGAVALIAASISLLAPSLLPTTFTTGFSVGVIAALSGVLSGLAADRRSPVMYGPRHIRAAGAQVLSSGRHPNATAIALGRVLRADPTDHTRVTAVLACRGVGTSAAELAHRCGTLLAGRDVRVLLIDLAAGRQDADGASEVAFRKATLAEAVRFEGDLTMAQLGPGRDPAQALDGLGPLVERLPADLEEVFVVLPTDEPRARGLGLQDMDWATTVLILAERGVTSRAALDEALARAEVANVEAHVVLVDPIDGRDDDATSTRITPGRKGLADDDEAATGEGVADLKAVGERMTKAQAAASRDAVSTDSGITAPAVLLDELPPPTAATAAPATAAPPRPLTRPLAQRASASNEPYVAKRVEPRSDARDTLVEDPIPSPERDQLQRAAAVQAFTQELWSRRTRDDN